MGKPLPDWYAKITPLLVAGRSLTEAAAAVGAPLRTATRHLNAPGSVLAAMVAAAKADQSKIVEDELGPLRTKALKVLETALDADGKVSLDAAKALLGKLVSPAEAPAPAEERPAEEEIEPAAACREVALSLAAFPELFRRGMLDRESIDLLRSAAAALLEDDLAPRPPLDCEADRVDVASLAPEPSPESRPVADGGAAVIPIRG